MKDKKNKNFKNKREERGFVLVVGVIIASFLLLLAIPFMFQINTERRLSVKSLKTLSALSLAEAGIERAIWEMNKGDLSAWSGDGTCGHWLLTVFNHRLGVRSEISR